MAVRGADSGFCEENHMRKVTREENSCCSRPVLLGAAGTAITCARWPPSRVLPHRFVLSDPSPRQEGSSPKKRFSRRCHECE